MWPPCRPFGEGVGERRDPCAGSKGVPLHGHGRPCVVRLATWAVEQLACAVSWRGRDGLGQVAPLARGHGVAMATLCVGEGGPTRTRTSGLRARLSARRPAWRLAERALGNGRHMARLHAPARAAPVRRTRRGLPVALGAAPTKARAREKAPARARTRRSARTHRPLPHGAKTRRGRSPGGCCWATAVFRLGLSLAATTTGRLGLKTLAAQYE
jgi:hypothetical protein